MENPNSNQASEIFEQSNIGYPNNKFISWKTWLNFLLIRRDFRDQLWSCCTTYSYPHGIYVVRKVLSTVETAFYFAESLAVPRGLLASSFLWPLSSSCGVKSVFPHQQWLSPHLIPFDIDCRQRHNGSSLIKHHKPSSSLNTSTHTPSFNFYTYPLL